MGVLVSAIMDAASAAAGPSSVAIMAWRSMARLPLYGAGASQSVAGGGAALYGRSVTKPRDALYYFYIAPKSAPASESSQV